MRWTKNWGTVSGNAELYMLNHAERTRKEIERIYKKKPADKGDAHNEMVNDYINGTVHSR